MVRYWILGTVAVICITVISVIILRKYSASITPPSSTLSTVQNSKSVTHTIRTSDNIFLSVNADTTLVQALRGGQGSRFIFQKDGSIIINHGFLGLWDYGTKQYIARVLIQKTPWNIERRAGSAIALSTVIDGHTLYLGILKNGDLYFAIGFQSPPNSNVQDQFYLG